jgi:hypothetical protein
VSLADDIADGKKRKWKKLEDDISLQDGTHPVQFSAGWLTLWNSLSREVHHFYARPVYK